LAEPNLASRTVSNVLHAHYGWYIVAMGTTLQLTTNFVSQAFAILVVVMRDNFGWSLTAIVLAYSLRNIIGALLSPYAGSWFLGGPIRRQTGDAGRRRILRRRADTA